MIVVYLLSHNFRPPFVVSDCLFMHKYRLIMLLILRRGSLFLNVKVELLLHPSLHINAPSRDNKNIKSANYSKKSAWIS